MAAQQSTQQQQQDTTRSSSRTFLNAVSKTIERVIPSKKPNPEANTDENILKSGVLQWRESDSKQFKPFTFNLNSKGEFFVYAEKKKIKMSMELSQSSILDNKDSQFQFTFMLSPNTAPNKKPAKSWILGAQSAEELNDWKTVLKQTKMGEKLDSHMVQIEEKLRNNAYNIQPSDLTWENELVGKGASGIVRKGIWLGTTQVAVKVLNNLPEYLQSDELQSFYAEIELLSQLRHPNIVSMFGYCKKDNYLCLVTAFVNGGDLHRVIYDKNATLDFALKIKLLLAISSGMVYLHSKGLIHRDLKPANILVENLNEAKIQVCDFGLSTVLRNISTTDDKKTTIYGSPSYAAPEISKPDHDDKVDVFSFAVVMHELYTRMEPWPTLKIPAQIFEKVQSGVRMPIPADCPLKDIITSSWEQDPSKRPSFKELYVQLQDVLKNAPSFEEQTNSQFEASILREFKGKDSLDWISFEKKLSSTLGVGVDLCERIKYLLIDQTGNVTKERWKKLLEWFSPLRINDAYHSEFQQQQNEQPAIGWTLDEIVAIVDPKAFFGWLGTNETRELLSAKGAGSYLFRFSGSTPGSYTLSVSLGNGVGHWRISCEKVSKNQILLKLENKTFKTFAEIVQLYEVLPLKSTVDSNLDVTLKESCDRGKDLPSGKF